LELLSSSRQILPAGRLHLAGGQLNAVELLQLRDEWVLHLEGMDAHQQRQGLRGHIVRPPGRPAGVLAQVRILLALEQGLA